MPFLYGNPERPPTLNPDREPQFNRANCSCSCGCICNGADGGRVRDSNNGEPRPCRCNAPQRADQEIEQDLEATFAMADEGARLAVHAGNSYMGTCVKYDDDDRIVVAGDWQVIFMRSIPAVLEGIGEAVEDFRQGLQSPIQRPHSSLSMVPEPSSSDPCSLESSGYLERPLDCSAILLGLTGSQTPERSTCSVHERPHFFIVEPLRLTSDRKHDRGAHGQTRRVSYSPPF